MGEGDEKEGGGFEGEEAHGERAEVKAVRLRA